MAQQQLPITFAEVLNLPSMGVDSNSIKFGSCSMESDKFITICEAAPAGGQTNVVMVDMAAGNAITRRPMAAEAAIMNPVSKVIALRAGQTLQIFNLELRAKMKSHNLSEVCVFWRWITPNTIALVTPSAVFHWSIEGDAAPVKMFDRHASLSEGTQIINYQVSADGKWCLLGGIAQGAGGVIVGTMQLYSVDKSVSQVLNGHTGVFTTIRPEGRSDDAQVLCFEEKKPDQPARLLIMEVGRDKDAPGGVFRTQPQPIPVPPDTPADFPVTMQASSQHGILYMITKMGFLYLFDIHTGKPIYRARISTDTIFVACEHTATGGVLGITARKGQVLHVSLNEHTLIPYIVNTLRDNQLAIEMATRLNLGGADELYVAEFNRLMAGNDINGAARLAAASPQGLLRTPQTIQRFQQMPSQPGQPQPVFQYFSILLEKGKLNQLESIELARPVLQQGRANLLEKWLGEDKLECSEELGDIVAPVDVNLALSVYLRANVPDKVINCYVQRGEFDKIVQYATKVGYQCDYTYMLQGLVRSNPQGAAEFAKQLALSGLIDANAVVDIFMSVNLLRETNAFLLEVLKENKASEGHLQTRLLELNLLGGMPQVADAILGNEMFTHYDRPYIAKLCEQAGLYQRALQHYSTPADIKRVMQNSGNLNPEFVVSFFGGLSREASIEILRDMLGKNMRQNLQIVVSIASKYSDQLGSEHLIKLFEDFKCTEGLFYYLANIVNTSQEPQVHFKYIEAAAKMQQYKEVERVCRDSTVYDPQQVKQFLIESKLADPRPLIHVCDRYDFVDEMTSYLYSNNLMKYIEVYCTKVSPQKTPQVIGKLLDLDCNEDFVRNLLNSVQACPVEDLVEEVERRNRLRLLQPWLEIRISQGNTETATHNAIGKIYIQLNRDPVQFLQNNQFYDPKVLGAFCEKLDPSLAFLAYKHAGGACDEDLIRVTNEHGLFKDQARYLVERQDLDLWHTVLMPEGYEEGDEPPHRRALIDQVVQTALPETKNPDEVSTTVKAFINADMPHELIELLERLVLQGTDFANNRNLQNLLILTAIRADKEKVFDFINRLDNFDGPDIARIAAGDEYQLFEEAFAIYVKFAKKTTDPEEKTTHNVCAIEVLVDKIQNLERAKEFAERVNDPPVWSKLARAQLDEHFVQEAISSYIRAQDPSHYTDVIAAAEAEGSYAPLVPFLQMARKEIKEAQLDTMLIYALAKTQHLSELEEFLSAPNVAKIDQIGERLFDEGMYEAAKLLFISINNNAKLALCYVKLGQYREAVDAATKANSIATWKAVNRACIKAGEFRLANICGLRIIVHPDHLEELILEYERAGHPNELIQLMEQGLGQEGTHSGIFTELGVLYTKYNPSKLMEHIKIFWSRMHVPKLLKACERALLWDEAVYLYKEDGQHDAAVRTMIEHPVAFQHDLFLDCVQKARNPEVQYRAILFYLEQQPRQLERLLQVLTPTLDHARVVHMLKKQEAIPLAIEYLKAVQKEDLSAVNEALNEFYIEEEDFESLRQSIDEHQNFDQVALAQRIDKHELLEFRRIAAYVYKNNKRWEQSIRLSKDDKMYKDAIDTAAASRERKLAEELLGFFVEARDKACFSATLYTCYDLIRPDVAVELAWRNGYVDYVMPYMIQYLRHSHEKLHELDERTKPKKNEAEEDASAAAAAAAMGGMGFMMDQMHAGPLLMNAPYNGPGGMGMHQDPYASAYGTPGMGMGQMHPGMGMHGMGHY